ncbi:MAG: hypothetical protein KGY99_04755 [Phycisphaerae bacterium]|nr:hypothetical protein [Phycisphaerae bacterium]
MCRITVRISFVFGVAMLLGGCGREYGHERLDDASEPSRRVREMIAALRSAGTENLAVVYHAQCVAELSEDRADRLRTALRRIAQADAAELRKLDAYGGDVLRASIELQSGQRRKTVFLLLVAKGDKLLWAGVN